jgi:hypothetical protein
MLRSYQLLPAINGVPGCIGLMLPAQWRSMMPIADNNLSPVILQIKSVSKLVIRAGFSADARHHFR